ncbi:MAG: DUF2807 domain-containing protein, partial [Pseudomonadota bacterium]|nr:DUF2807 domain-containing protein [Pseudomonadota bacterium]
MKRSTKILMGAFVVIVVSIVATIAFFSHYTYQLDQGLLGYPEQQQQQKLLKKIIHEIIKGDGKIISSTKSLAQFNTLSISGDYKITIQEGQKPEIILTTDGNIQKHINVQVNAGELSVKSDKSLQLLPTEDIEVRIVVPKLHAAQMTGNNAVRLLNLHS